MDQLGETARGVRAALMADDIGPPATGAVGVAAPEAGSRDPMRGCGRLDRRLRIAIARTGS